MKWLHQTLPKPDWVSHYEEVVKEAAEKFEKDWRNQFGVTKMVVLLNGKSLNIFRGLHTCHTLREHRQEKSLH